MDPYAERVDIDPKAWGTAGWAFLEAVAASYPKIATPYDQAWMTTFLIALGDALPCEKCRRNHKTFLRMYPISEYVGGRMLAMHWMASYKQWAKNNA